eukprot:g35332.t1
MATITTGSNLPVKDCWQRRSRVPGDAEAAEGGGGGGSYDTMNGGVALAGSQGGSGGGGDGVPSLGEIVGGGAGSPISNMLVPVYAWTDQSYARFMVGQIFVVTLVLSGEEMDYLTTLPLKWIRSMLVAAEAVCLAEVGDVTKLELVELAGVLQVELPRVVAEVLARREEGYVKVGRERVRLRASPTTSSQTVIMVSVAPSCVPQVTLTSSIPAVCIWSRPSSQQRFEIL